MADTLGFKGTDPNNPMGWRYGGTNIGGRPFSYWQENPDQFMEYILGREAPNMSSALKDWVRSKVPEQNALWNAYNQYYGQVKSNGDWNSRPLGDWFTSFMGLESSPWAGGDGGGGGGQIMGAPAGGVGGVNTQEGYRNFMRQLATNLATGSSQHTMLGTPKGALGWSESYKQATNSPRDPYSALNLMLAASGYAPMVQANMLSRADQLRAQYGGLGEGRDVPRSWVDWLYRNLV